MIVACQTCGLRFEDYYRSTLCPHDAFAANDGNNVFSIHDDAYLENNTMLEPQTLTAEYMKQIAKEASRLKEVLKSTGPEGVIAICRELVEAAEDVDALREWPKENLAILLDLATVKFYELIYELEKEHIESN